MFLPPKAEKRPGVIFQHMEKPRVILQHRALQTYFWWQEGPPFVKGQGLEMQARVHNFSGKQKSVPAPYNDNIL